MSDDLRNQIYLNFSHYETKELLEIWRAHDRYQWSEMTFVVIREILQERQVELPPRREAVYKTHTENDYQGTGDLVTKWMPLILRSVLLLTILLVFLFICGWLYLLVIGPT